MALPGSPCSQRLPEHRWPGASHPRTANTNAKPDTDTNAKPDTDAGTERAAHPHSGLRLRIAGVRTQPRQPYALAGSTLPDPPGQKFFGRPSPRVAMMFFWISLAPPPIVSTTV